MIKTFDMSEIATVNPPMVTPIESGSSHKFFGHDMNFERIRNNFAAKCFELGVPNNKQGLYLAISTIDVAEEE